MSTGCLLHSDWMEWSCDTVATNHGRTVVVIFVSWFPGFEAAPAESMVTFGTGHAENRAETLIVFHLLILTPVHGNVLQAALVLLDLSLAAWAAFGDQLGEVFALSLHAHPFIKPSVVHPLRHVAAAGRVMSLTRRYRDQRIKPYIPTQNTRCSRQYQTRYRTILV